MKVSNRAGAMAAFVLAITSLIAAIYHIQILVPLLKEGQRTEAIVSAIDRGARNSKWAVYRFVTSAGKQVTHRDLFQMYIIRPEKGTEITVIYDPADASRVTADLGRWVWQGPVIFMSGFIFLFVLGIAIPRYDPDKKKDHKT